MKSRSHNRLLGLTILATSLVLAACTSYPLSPPEPGAPAPRSTILVFRGDAMNAGLVSAEVAVASLQTILRNRQFVRLAVEPGSYEATVKGPAGETSKVKVEVSAGGSNCLEVRPNPANAAKALTPIIGIYYGQIFLIDITSCPQREALALLREVGSKVQVK